MLALRAALQNDHAITLDAAALDIAAIEYPSLAPQPYLAALDAIAERIDACRGSQQDGPAFIEAANHHLFEILGLQGNETDYYDARNSCLNDVLDRKLGLPITLAVVYMEVARRLRRPVFGIGLPGHFIVQYDDDRFSAFIDPFHQGRLLGLEDCRRLARQIAGVEVSPGSSLLKPVSNQYILIRMLNNLRSSYSRTNQPGKLVTVLDLLIGTSPNTAEYYRHRGAAHLHLKEFVAARHDFGTYLKILPDAPDRQEVAKQIEAIHRWLASVN